MKIKLKISLIALCFIFPALFCEKNFKTLKIISYSPLNHSVGILPDFYTEIVFSNDVIRSDVEEKFSLTGRGDTSGSFEWLSERSFRYRPANPVTRTGRYIMELPRFVRDIDGNTMDSDFISDFYLGSDFVNPVIISSDPVMTNGAADGIPVNREITVSFSKSMNRESAEKSFSITPDVPGYFIWSENIPGVQNSRLTYRPLAEMSYGKLYSFTISAEAEDIAGNSLGADYRVNFITGSDYTPPSVNGFYDASVIPEYWDDSSVNITGRRVKIAADFSEAMDRTSVESAFTVIPSVQGSFQWESDLKVVFVPSLPLDPERNYQIIIDKSAKDINGLKLEEVYSVEIKTSNAASLYIKCGNISGTHDNSSGAYTLLSAGEPGYEQWPLAVSMGTAVPYNQCYYIRIQFVSSLEPYLPVEADKYSVMSRVLIETFKSGPGGVTVGSARITDVLWPDNTTVVFKLDPLTNKASGHIPALYRLTLAGGASGIKDIEGNYPERDIVIEFREAL